MDAQRIKDTEQLRILSLCHYVVAGLAALGSLLFLIHVGLGLMMIFNPTIFVGKGDGPPPALIGYAFAGLGLGALTFGLGYAALTAFAGKCLKQQTNRKLILASAYLNCLSVPIGTALGIFTIITLQKPSVIAMFDENQIDKNVLATAGIGGSGEVTSTDSGAILKIEQAQPDHTLITPQSERERLELLKAGVRPRSSGSKDDNLS